MEMSHLASKLKALKLDLSDDLLEHLVLISLPAQFNQFKVSYNCQKEKWTLNELISFCAQEEERLKQERTESAHLASTSKLTGKRKHKGRSCYSSGSGTKETKSAGWLFLLWLARTQKEGLCQIRRLAYKERYISCFGLF